MFALILHGTHQTNEKKQRCHFLLCRGFCSSECTANVARQQTIFDKACVVYAVQSRHLCVTALIDYRANHVGVASITVVFTASLWSL